MDHWGGRVHQLAHQMSYFSMEEMLKPGKQLLETLIQQLPDFISFSIVIGSLLLLFGILLAYFETYNNVGGGICEAADRPLEEVQVHFSKDSGRNWTFLKKLPYNGHRIYDVIKISLPTAAKFNGTRFRWIQGSYSSTNLDTWALGNVSCALALVPAVDGYIQEVELSICVDRSQ